jgi:hypothetical protein
VQGEPFRLRGRGAAPWQRLPVQGRRPAGAPLIEKEDAIVVERLRGPGIAGARPRRGAAGAALEIHEPGQLVELVGRRDDLAAEHRDPLAVGPPVVERHTELVVRHDEPWQSTGGFSHPTQRSGLP